MSGQKAYQLQAPKEGCPKASWAQQGTNYKFFYRQQHLNSSDLPHESASRKQGSVIPEGATMTDSQKPGGWGTIRKALCAFSESKSVSFQNKVLISQKPQSHREGVCGCVSGCGCVGVCACMHMHTSALPSINPIWA